MTIYFAFFDFFRRIFATKSFITFLELPNEGTKSALVFDTISIFAINVN